MKRRIELGALRTREKERELIEDCLQVPKHDHIVTEGTSDVFNLLLIMYFKASVHLTPRFSFETS